MADDPETPADDQVLSRPDEVETRRRPFRLEDRSEPTSDAVVMSRDEQQVDTLPRYIAGGFVGLASDLDRRSRDEMMMVRLLEQQRNHLATAEAERDRLYEALARVAPEVTESGHTLRDTMDAAKAGDLSGDLSDRFSRNLRALDELENLAQALSANLLWMRSGWEQYARSVIGAQKMRSGGGT